MSESTQHTPAKGRFVMKAAVIAVLAVAVAAVVYVKNQDSAPGAGHVVVASSTAEEPTQAGVPRLIDLGADKCIPCKMMEPILDELKEEYAGSMEVVFIDIWKNPGAGEAYGVQVIPTQIFYDASGKELYRHQGFISKEDILAKWRELGVNVKPADTAEQAAS